MKEFRLKEKEAVVSSIKESFDGAQSIVFYDYRGLTVEEATELRKQMREAGVEYKVLKNTMIKRAFAALGVEGVDDILEGPTAVAVGKEDPVAPARIISEFAKKVKKTEMKGGLVYGKVASVQELEYLATLPSKEQLIASLMSVINGVTSKFVRTLEAIRVQKEEQA